MVAHCSASIRSSLTFLSLLCWLHAGFFLLHYMHAYRKHLQRLVGAWRSGRLHVTLDPTPFKCAAPPVTWAASRACHAVPVSEHTSPARATMMFVFTYSYAEHCPIELHACCLQQRAA